MTSSAIDDPAAGPPPGDALIDDLRQREATYRTLFESTEEGFCVIEVMFDADDKVVDYRFLDANPAFVRQTGLVDAVGKTMRELAPNHEQHWFDIYARIARTGEPAQFEDGAAALGRWYEVSAVRVGSPGDNRVAILFRDILPRRQAEVALLENADRQAFLLNFSDTIRAAPTPAAVAEEALRLIADKLQLDRCYLVEFDMAGDRAEFPYQFHRRGFEPLPGGVRLSDFPASVRRVIDRTLVVHDSATDTSLEPSDRAALTAIGQRSFVAASLRHGKGKPIAAMVAVCAEPHPWKPAEVALVEDVAERTWVAVERARVEAALRASELKYRTLFDSIDEGFAVVEVILDAEGKPVDLLHLEANAAYEEHTGLRDIVGKRALDVVPEGGPWLDFYGQVALTGQAARSENYLPAPVDRWIASYASRIGGEGSMKVAIVFNDISVRKRAEAVLRDSESRLLLLVAELQHRVRNILTIVRSVFGRTVSAGGTTQEIADHFRGRLDALARTQVTSTQTITGTVDLENLIRDELLAVGERDGERLTIEGPDVALAPKAAESIGLAIHELTTNAIKYGALSATAGRLDIRWETNLVYRGQRRLTITWTEQGVPIVPLEPSRRGFGSELIEEALPYRLGAETKLEFRGGGVCCTISVPLPEPGAEVPGV